MNNPDYIHNVKGHLKDTFTNIIDVYLCQNEVGEIIERS